MNAEAIPASGPVLIVGSHGNDLPDILMTFLASRRDVIFVANMAAADSPLVQWTYAGLGVIPVSRVRDTRALKAQGKNARAINKDAFVRVVDALKGGHCVAVFPEGIVPDVPRIGPLRNGAAKMALQAIDEGVTALKIVPIGYQYECAHEVRSAVAGIVGDSVAVSDWIPVHPEKRVRDFTDFVSGLLHRVTRCSRTQHDADVLATVAAVGGAVLRTGSQNVMEVAHEVQSAVSKLSAADGIFVANSVAPAVYDNHAAILEFQNLSLQFAQISSKFGGRDWSLRDQTVVLNAATDDRPDEASSFALLTVLAPVAALGWLWHAIPWWASRVIAHKFAPRKAELAAITIVPGLYVMVLWYLLMPSLLLAFGISHWLVLALFLAQPRLGDVAMLWRDWWRYFRLRARVQRASPEILQRLRETSDALLRGWEQMR